ncbi:hypothetical protein [Halonotius sp. GCM10025705]|uniref:hypothetical protein n=1 Tax=Halonotius sp. GCM10025705 TaxID=3252678 RepID=UPI00362019EF
MSDSHNTSNEEAQQIAEAPVREPSADSKIGLWHEWVENTILQDINSSAEADPIELFETNENLVVETKISGDTTILRRSEGIDRRIRHEGKKCVDEDGVKRGASGLIYVLYQLTSDAKEPSPEDIIPRYIGKAEAYGKKNELSANFEEIAKDYSSTRSFARWGDGNAWHIGELSRTVYGKDSKKLSWAANFSNKERHDLQIKHISGSKRGIRRPIQGHMAIQHTSRRLSRCWLDSHMRRILNSCSIITKFRARLLRTVESLRLLLLIRITEQSKII